MAAELEKFLCNKIELELSETPGSPTRPIDHYNIILFTYRRG